MAVCVIEYEISYNDLLKKIDATKNFQIYVPKLDWRGKHKRRSNEKDMPSRSKASTSMNITCKILR